MNLYKQWQDLIGNQTQATYPKFWDEYSAAEIKIYKDILTHPDDVIAGTFQELTEKYQVSDVLFMGFLDGGNSSFKEPFDEKALESITPESDLSFQFDLEKLYFNMHNAKADHLYVLPEWEDVLSAEKREAIVQEYKKSRTVVKGPQTGRNDPCPCGSGKKFKKCCGMSQTE